VSKLHRNEKAGGAVDLCIRFGGIIWPRPQRQVHVYETLWHKPLGSSTGTAVVVVLKHCGCDSPKQFDF